MMKITHYSSTNEVLTEMGKRIKSARIAMNITQREMSEITGLSMRTITNLESGKDVSFSTVIEALRPLGQLQSIDILVPEQTIRPSQIIELGKPRERASSKKKTSGNWKWGDEE